MIREQWQRALTLIQLPWFVRVLPGKVLEWEEGVGDCQTLADHAFEKDSEGVVSVFYTRDVLQEAKIISAYQQKRGHLANTSVVRFSGGELRRAGVAVRRCDGDTGIPSVDTVHHDLSGDASNFAALAKAVLEKQHAGHERVRKLQKPRMASQLRQLGNGHEALSTYMRERCLSIAK